MVCTDAHTRYRCLTLSTRTLLTSLPHVSPRKQMKWDRKKKKFVQEGSQNEGKNKKIRTESGNVIHASYNTKIYEEWKKKHHVGHDNQSIPSLPNGRARGRGNYAKTPGVCVCVC